jgi:predicted house-cleaning noncanonical NTP pyrophosphatase (MazG superfamily)
MTPKKLIRNKIIPKLKEGEWETIQDQDELNRLYDLKIREELEEVKASGHKDIKEFADLIAAVYAFARVNGFSSELQTAILNGYAEKGKYDRLALNNLNPANPSNRLYFETNQTDMMDELAECIQNLLGHFDTPIAKLKMRSEDCKIVRENAHSVLNKYFQFKSPK